MLLMARRGCFLIQNLMILITYLREVIAEFSHVSWPTPRQTVMYTVLVILISLATAAYLGVLDYVFSTILKRIINF